MSAAENLHRRHTIAEAGTTVEGLASILAEDAVFHSPVVHTPQEGRDKVIAYLYAAGKTFSDTRFDYVRKITDGPHAMLEFTANLEGIHLNGIDIITFNDDGRAA